jgi:hypothetical protein
VVREVVASLLTGDVVSAAYAAGPCIAVATD